MLQSLGEPDATLERERRATALAALASPPRDAEGLSSWMGRLEESAPPFDLLYIVGTPAPGEEKGLFATAPSLEAFYRSQGSSKNFIKGMESASYEETYAPGKVFDVGGRRCFLLFAPAVEPRTRKSLVVAFDALGRSFSPDLHPRGGPLSSSPSFCWWGASAGIPCGIRHRLSSPGLGSL